MTRLSRSIAATFAPSAMKARAIASPIPRAAPKTATTCPSSPRSTAGNSSPLQVAQPGPVSMSLLQAGVPAAWDIHDSDDQGAHQVDERQAVTVARSSVEGKTERGNGPAGQPRDKDHRDVDRRPLQQVIEQWHPPQRDEGSPQGAGGAMTQGKLSLGGIERGQQEQRRPQR